VNSTQIIAERIKIQAKNKNITVKGLLESCNLSKNTVNKLSNGADIGTQSILKIAQALDCSVDYLLGKVDASKDLFNSNNVINGNYNANINTTISVNGPIPSKDTETSLFDASLPPPYERYSTCFVAYLDLLGFSKKSISSDFETLYLMLSRFSRSFEEFKSINQLSKLSNAFEAISTSYFSDSLVLSIPCSTPGSLEALLNVVNIICLKTILNSGVFCRGGVSYGNFYSNDNMIFGDALTKAVKLERDCAINPRVILDRGLIQHYEFFTNTSCNDSLNYLINNSSDYCEADYISHAFWRYSELLLFDKTQKNNVEKLFEKVKNAITSGYNSQNDERIKSKYEWLEKYFNSAIPKNISFECKPIS